MKLDPGGIDMIRRDKRTAFTLLEVLLAMGIGLLLLGALYVAVDTQLKHAAAAREVVEQSTLARALITRIADDVSSTITLSDPARFRNQASAAPSTTGAGASGAGASGMPDATGATTATNAATAYPVTLGLIGDNQTLHLFVTRLPRDAINARGTDTAPPVSDTRRISYWLIGDGSNGGLAKQEVQPFTADDAQITLPPGIENENSYVIADEVRSLRFQYWDGSVWNDKWPPADTQFGADGVTPIGPPVAVSIEIGLPGIGGPEAPVKIYRHVVAIATANGGGTPSP